MTGVTAEWGAQTPLFDVSVFTGREGVLTQRVKIPQGFLSQQKRGKKASPLHLHLILMNAHGLTGNKLDNSLAVHRSISIPSHLIPSIWILKHFLQHFGVTADTLSCQISCYFLSHPTFLSIKLHSMKRLDSVKAFRTTTQATESHWHFQSQLILPTLRYDNCNINVNLHLWGLLGFTSKWRCYSVVKI